MDPDPWQIATVTITVLSAVKQISLSVELCVKLFKHIAIVAVSGLVTVFYLYIYICMFGVVYNCFCKPFRQGYTNFTKT